MHKKTKEIMTNTLLTAVAKGNSLEYRVAQMRVYSMLSLKWRGL